MVAVRHRWQGGKHANVESPVAPDYEIRSFHELLQILRSDFGLTI